MPLIATTGTLNNSVVGRDRTLPSYKIERCLRLRYNATASSAGRLERTFSGSNNQTKWTYSVWVKRGNITTGQWLLFATTGGSNQLFGLYIDGSNQLVFDGNNGGGSQTVFKTANVFRDPSAWYHIVLRADTNNATQANRLMLWVNGVQITFFTTTPLPSLGATYYINGQNNAHQINVTYVSNNGYMSAGDGYFAEINFIDNQALSPSDFGLIDENGIWQPKKYVGTYTGTSFYLNFSNPTVASASALGRDSSGLGNNWTPTNVSVTSGITNDSFIDSPTSYFDGTVYGRGNYPVLNPLNTALGGATFSDGNLKVTTSAAQNYAKPTMFPTSGKWYYEFTINAKANSTFNQYAIYINSDIDSIYAGYEQTGQFYNGSAWNGSAVYSTWATNGIIGVALDIDAGTVRFYYNGTAQGSGTISIPSRTSTGPVVYSQAASNEMYANFGQRPFVYTPPTGFRALNTQNLPTPAIPNPEAHFKTTLWTGTGSNQAISNRNANTQVSFSPAFVWNKARQSVALSNIWTDILKGHPLQFRSQLFSDQNVAAESRTDRLQSFDSDGFTVGTYQDVNLTSNTFVAWQWNANKSNTFNTSGTSTSNTIVNSAAGFSMVVYAGTGVNATVGHGLPKAPEFIISKAINDSGRSWPVYHVGSGSNTSYLNTTAGPSLDSTIWTAAPNNSVFFIGTGADINRNININIAYCWTSIPGYSSFGTYTGNGNADGPFVNLGFKPRWIMLKRSQTGATSDWLIYDTARPPNFNSVFYNYPSTQPRTLNANETTVESTSTSAYIDVVSNGFKIRLTLGYNNSGTVYLYAAFAELPLKYSTRGC